MKDRFKFRVWNNRVYWRIKMWQKIKCWLGWHEFETWQKGFTGSLGSVDICKHCGKEIPYEKRENNFCNSSTLISIPPIIIGLLGNSFLIILQYTFTA